MFFIYHAHTLCLVLGSVHDFSPRERVIDHFVPTVNKLKQMYQSQPQDPTVLRCSFVGSRLNLYPHSPTKAPWSFVGSFRSPFKGGSFEFQLLIFSQRSIPLNLKGVPLLLPLLLNSDSQYLQKHFHFFK